MKNKYLLDIGILVTLVCLIAFLHHLYFSDEPYKPTAVLAVELVILSVTVGFLLLLISAFNESRAGAILAFWNILVMPIVMWLSFNTFDAVKDIGTLTAIFNFQIGSIVATTGLCFVMIFRMRIGSQT